jgi:hypothetical protein
LLLLLLCPWQYGNVVVRLGLRHGRYRRRVLDSTSLLLCQTDNISVNQMISKKTARGYPGERSGASLRVGCGQKSVEAVAGAIGGFGIDRVSRLLYVNMM